MTGQNPNAITLTMPAGPIADAITALHGETQALQEQADFWRQACIATSGYLPEPERSNFRRMYGLPEPVTLDVPDGGEPR